MARNDLILRIGADDSELRKTFKRLNNDLVRQGEKLQSIGQSLSLSLSAPIALAGGAAIKAFADFDKLEKGLEAVSGSAELAKEQFDNLKSIVADTTTTLDLKSAAKASLLLQGVGVDATNAERAIKALSQAATLSGASADDVGEIARQFAQATAKGTIMQEELSVALERIPVLAGVINREFGTVTAEGLRDAGISATDFVQRLVGAIEADEKFQNVQGGLAKSFETFSTNVQIAGAELGKAISETVNLESVLNTVSDTIGRVVSGFTSLSPQTKALVVGFGGFAAALGPVSIGIGTLLKTLPLLSAGITALLSPLALAGAAIGLLGVAIFSEYTAVDAATVAQNRLNEALKEAKAAIDREKDAVAGLTQEIRSETATKGDKARAIEELKRISPEYFGQLDVERLKTQDLTAAVDAYNESLRRVTLQKLNQESLEAQLELEKVTKQLELAQAQAKQTAGQFGTGAGFGVSQTITRLEKRRDELLAAIDALADASRAEIDTLNSQVQTPGAPSPATAPGVADPVTIPAKVEVTGTEALDEVKEKLELLPVAPLETINGAFTRFDEFVTNGAPERLAEGFTIAGDAAQLLRDKMEALNAQQEKLAKFQKAVSGAFEQGARSQGNALKAAGDAALAAARDVVKAEIIKTISLIISDSFAKFGIFGAIAAAGAGALAGSLFSKALGGLNIPAFGDGGFVDRPTLALIGEKGPEYVVPARNIQTMNGGGFGGFAPGDLIAETYVDIDRLRIALKRAENDAGRAF